MDRLKECSICCEVYNEDDHRPLVLPCGHTLCKECINNIISGLWTAVVECPICRRKHTVNKNQLPTNFVVLDLLRTTDTFAQPKESIVQESTCEDHHLKFKENNPKSEEKKSKSGNSGGLSTKAKIGIGVGAVAGGVGAILAAPIVLTGVGFTSAGIAASSWAASMMSAAAVANGGGVAAGGVVAVLQSAGAVGLSTGAAAGVGGVGAAVGTGIAAGVAKLTGRKHDNTNSNSEKCADDKEFGKEYKDDTNILKKEEDDQTFKKNTKVVFTKKQMDKEFEDSDDDLINV